ncbi:MAG: hypothetical protein JWM97_3078 [Phycisphaerales bacterium]|nr:hypothetical protein [Phycisphaerales bacterium]
MEDLNRVGSFDPMEARLLHVPTRKFSTPEDTLAGGKAGWFRIASDRFVRGSHRKIELPEAISAVCGAPPIPRSR